MNNRIDPSKSQIVLYKGNFLENEMRRVHQKLMHHVFQVGLFAYPMQQKQLKREIRLLISQQSLPYQAFRSVFPKIVEITKQKDKVPLLFDLFRFFAENPSEEICGRFYWSIYKGKHPELNGKKGFLDITMCGVTSEALISAIFGLDGLKKMKHLRILDVKNEVSLKKAGLRIANNSRLLEMEPGKFITYSFQIQIQGIFPGHAFLVIQYLNKQKKLEYRIVQSYVSEYCLRDDLKSNTVLDSGEFMIFLEGIQECLSADTWTHALERFYIDNFKVKKGFRIGGINPCKGACYEIKWGVGSLADILIAKDNYESFKRSPEFLNIEATKSSRVNVDQSPEVLAAKKEYFEKLYQELRCIYEKNESVIEQEFIRVNLDLLDLDLAEEGLLNVPARDENGTFILDEEGEVKWREKIVTLRTATENFIIELNKLIKESTFKTPENNKKLVLLNKNKEPFRTYAMLGVPLDNHYLGHYEDTQLWIHRIIHALVSKGYISKLYKVNGHGYFIEV